MAQALIRSNVRRLAGRKTALLLGAALLASAAGFLQNRVVRLNDDLEHNLRGSFQSPALTPDGSRVVYLANTSEAQVYELYVSPSDGSGGALRLSAPLVAGGNVQSFLLAPDGSQVFYQADQETDGVNEFYGVPIDGVLPPVNLNGSMTAGLNFSQFSPDGAWAVFLANNASGRPELYSAAMDGSQPAVRLNGPLVAGGSVRADKISVSPDSVRVVYQAFQEGSALLELFSVPIGGGPAVKLNGTLPSGGDVDSALISSDGAWVAYLADQVTNNVLELFGVPITGGTAVRLNGALPAGATIYPFSISSTPGVPRVVYRQSSTTAELYSVPADGSLPPVKLNSPLPAGISVDYFSISPQAARVVYQSNTLQAAVFSAPLDGGQAAVQLSSTPPAGTHVDGFTIAPGGSRVVYWTRPDGSGLSSSLFAAPTDGSASAVLLSDARPGILASFSPALTPDGSRVVYVRRNGSQHDLFSAPLDDSHAPVKLNGSLPAPSTLPPTAFAFASSSTAVFLASTAGITELYRVPVDASAMPSVLNGPLGLQETVTSFQLSADQGRVLYTANEPLFGVSELFSVAPDGASPAVRVNDPLPHGPYQGDVQEFVLSSDGSRVVYAAPQDYYGVAQLYVAPTDGSSQAARLDADPFPVSNLALMPDGQSVLYLSRPPDAFQNSIGEFRLALLDGSQPPQELPGTYFSLESLRVSADGAYALFRQVDFYQDAILSVLRLDGSGPATLLDERDVLFDCKLSPDGSRAVYRRGPLFAGSEPPFFTELRSARCDGSTGPIALSGPLADDREVTTFGLTPDGLRACYLADSNADERFELFSVPIDGSVPALRLSGTLVANGDVSILAVAPAGHYVAYLADQAVDERYELYGVVSDGSSPAVKLNPTLVAGGDVFAIAVSPDGTRVVYTADQSTNDVIELYSVPIDGSLPATRISGPLVAGRAVVSYQFSADGSRVVYLADQDRNDVIELYSVPIGGGAVVHLNNPPVSGGDVITVVPSADSHWVVYLADEIVDGVNELFRARIDSPGIAERLSGPLVPGGGVSGPNPSFRVGPDARTVVFTADKLQNDVIELFSSTPAPVGKVRPR